MCQAESDAGYTFLRRTLSTRPAATMMQLPEKISIASVAISLTAAAFTCFQWWNGDASDKIKVAVEISRSYPKDHTMEEQAALMNAYLVLKLDDKNVVPLSKVYEDLEYIAFLANSGRLNRKYLSKRVLCDLYLAGAAADRITGTSAENPRINSEISRFGKDDYCEQSIKSFVAANGLMSPTSRHGK